MGLENTGLEQSHHTLPRAIFLSQFTISEMKEPSNLAHRNFLCESGRAERAHKSILLYIHSRA